MFRDFIYLDTDRVQSVIAQLQEGLLDQVIEGNTKEVSGEARATFNLLAMLVPFSASASAGAKEGTDFSQTKVLHDYAFETALRSLREQGFVAEDPPTIPSTGFVLVSGSAQILDYETISSVAEKWDAIDEFFNPPVSGKAKKDRRNSSENRIIKDSKVIIDTFFRDAIRLRLRTIDGDNYIGPLDREHLRDDIRSLIFKYGSNPQDEWTILAQISRPPLTEENREQLTVEEEQQRGDYESSDDSPVSSHIDSVVDSVNSFQDFISAPASSSAIVAPIAIFREIEPAE